MISTCLLDILFSSNGYLTQQCCQIHCFLFFFHCYSVKTQCYSQSRRYIKNIGCSVETIRTCWWLSVLWVWHEEETQKRQKGPQAFFKQWPKFYSDQGSSFHLFLPSCVTKQELNCSLYSGDTKTWGMH